MDENSFLGAKGRISEIRELPTGGSRKDLFSEERGGRRNQKSSSRKAEAQAQFAAATEVVSNFCGNYPALHVQPSEEEMERLLQRCCEMRPVAVAKALHGELSWSSGDLSWQPRFRLSSTSAAEQIRPEGAAKMRVRGAGAPEVSDQTDAPVPRRR
eukprot:CAMPEP_0177383386 /NCGR_PEP_ID=MMETSP0368-20130122/49091_1 /TAXON_ID=447022 ORGANISM="Scrippsiella hangoei-like, Strain SHHI-4" /NCGR_SAMPLE_ID=MMETSP0368 /ASSEMBLY_ACC=CAM_ASM_000363 /LENGTH=155 /DNA_ID=CAMNT_0018847901 /DNA_START=29 /DNA_END=493 /DNA_ORIENTATION=-